MFAKVINGLQNSPLAGFRLNGRVMPFNCVHFMTFFSLIAMVLETKTFSSESKNFSSLKFMPLSLDIPVGVNYFSEVFPRY